MVAIRDDWEKPRSKGQKLTVDEVAKIRAGFNAGRKHRDIARELQCSSRVTAKYYGFYRDEAKYRRAIEVVEKPKPVRVSSVPVGNPRFYSSNFEIIDD
jgi:hypothetical protein